jgi:uncharacterized protein (DUF58 family)
MKRHLPKWVNRLGEMLTRDYLPAADPYWLDWARTPLAILGLAALAATLCGFFLHPHGFVLLFGIGVVTALGLVWPWLSVRGLGGRLDFGRLRVREGDSVQVGLTLRNRAPWGVWGLGMQIEGSDPAAAGLTRGLAYLPGRRTLELRWEYLAGRRGEYPTGTARLTCGFPFGLWKAKRPVTVETRLLVWPRTFPLGPIPQAAGDRTSEGLVFRNKPGTTGDVLGARPYRRGDALRRVHWAQTARHDRLVVCELQSPAHPLVQIVLDIDPAVHAGSGVDSSREWAIRIAASFLEGWLTQGAQLEAVIDGRLLAAGAGTAQVRFMLDALARVPLSPGPSLSALGALPDWSRYQGGLRILVTTDRGLRRAPAPMLRERKHRFVVLRAASFAPAEESGGNGHELPVEPWIWVDDPARVASQVRQGWREILHEG